jgi:hypothetical protein
MTETHVRLPSHLELLPALEEILARHNGDLGGIVELRSKLCDEQTSYSLVDLEIDFESGDVLRILLKDLGLENLHEIARLVKPEFLYNPMREIKTYQELLAHNCLDTAHYHGAVVRPEKNRFCGSVQSTISRPGAMRPAGSRGFTPGLRVKPIG